MSQFENQIVHQVSECEQLERSAFWDDEYGERHIVTDFRKKRKAKLVNKEETKERKGDRVAIKEDPDALDVTELVISNRDSKTGKRFKVFSTVISHQYGSSCQFTSSDKGVTY